MKKNILSKAMRVLAVAAMITLTGACGNQDNYIWQGDITAVSGPGVAGNQVTIGLGQKLQLTTSPADVAAEWTSSNEEVAVVSGSGLVTAVGLGEATISAYPLYKDGPVNGAYVIIKVKDMSLPFANDRIDQKDAE